MEKPIFENLETQYTDRLILRKFTMKDANDLYEYLRDDKNPKIRKYIDLPSYANINDAYSYISFLEGAYSDGISGCYAIEYDKKVIGSIEIRCINSHFANIGYVIGQKYWNNGFVTEALSKIIDVCFNVFGFNRVEATCNEENIASSRVMEKCNMKLEGIMRENRYKNGKYYSTKMYSILKSEYKK